MSDPHGPLPQGAQRNPLSVSARPVVRSWDLRPHPIENRPDRRPQLRLCRGNEEHARGRGKRASLFNPARMAGTFSD